MSDAHLMADFVSSVEKEIRKELRLRCEAYIPNLKVPEEFTVISALLARQASLAIEFSGAPQLWNGHSAPLFLRAMTDVHITIAWILIDPSVRAKQYIEHGLGQAILTVAHKREKLDDLGQEEKDELLKFIDAEENWINAQKFSFLVNVEIGAWSGKTTRAMAEEAGILGFYNHVYLPFSQCAHSTWCHVGKYNSAPTASPMTRHIWTPGILESSMDNGYLGLAAKYLDKSFDLFDEKVLRIEPRSNIQKWIYDEGERRFDASGVSDEE